MATPSNPGLWSVFSGLFLPAGKQTPVLEGPERCTQLTVAPKSDKALLPPNVHSSFPTGTSASQATLSFPLPLCHLPLVSPPGRYLTLLCPHASSVSGTHNTVPAGHPPCPHPSSTEFPLPLPCLPFNSQAQGPLLHKTSPGSPRLGQESTDLSPQNRH